MVFLIRLAEDKQGYVGGLLRCEDCCKPYEDHKEKLKFSLKLRF